MSHYADYYLRTINKHGNGLKLVLGGTGLGKTSSLNALLREGRLPSDAKLIYVANRIQLLNEMAALVGDLGLHIQQHKNAVQLQMALDDGSLAGFLDHPATADLLAEGKRRARLTTASPDELRGKAERLRQAQAWPQGQHLGLVNVDDLAGDLLRPLKTLYALAQELAAEAPAAEQCIAQKAASALAGLPVWPRLFPYLQFQADPACRLLLLTVQKAFHGVFDGQRTVRLGRWPAPPAGRYVFVFDEFDFLENNLLDLLAADREVSDPFGLVQTFYKRICRDKLGRADYLGQRPEWLPVRQAMEAIRDRVDVLAAKGIAFPETTHFVTADARLKGRAIFQSNFSLVNKPVFLAELATRPHSFALTQEPGGEGQKAFVLLDVVTRAVKDIIRLFNGLQANHETIYREVLRQAFGGTEYLAEIRQVNQIGAQHELCETNYGNLLLNGFGLYVVEGDKSQLTDPEEVALGYLSLNDSPEAMLRALARQHLVFGLSATAHIRRVLRNFDWTGLAHAAHPADSFAPLPNTAADAADVARANAEKAAVRRNAIAYHVAEPLPLATPLGRQLAALARTAPAAVFGNGPATGHRLRRVQHFFGLLARLAALEPAAPADGQTHLVFLTSFRQVRHALHAGDEDGWFEATPRPNKTALAGLQLYDVRCRDASRTRQMACTVVFYDAQFGQDLIGDEWLDEQYNALFWEGKPVVVVSTYASAGNGVNLQHYQSRADYEARRTAGRRDFRSLHLLEAPFFYFGGTRDAKSAADRQTAVKRDVYGVMKLLNAKLLSRAQATGELGHIYQLNRFNPAYLRSPDGILNQFSVYVQALGRIERVWQPMPDQELWLDRQVYGVFELLATDPQLAAERPDYLRYASDNVRQVLAAVAEAAPRQRQALDDELHDLRRANEAARAAIHAMVRDIEHFKRNGGQPEEVRQRWQWLRDDVLRHDLPAPLPPGEALPETPRPNQLQAIRGTFRSAYAHGGRLLLNRDLQVAPPTAHGPEFAPWDLNAVYQPLTGRLGSALSNHFRVRGYELAFVDSGTYLLPYVYQSILVGAVGEEAVAAVLQMEGLKASGKAVPDEVFEVADLRLENRPVFIDCKNYGARTQRQFALPPDDPFHHPNLNEPHFRAAMVRKWRTLHQSAAVPATPADPCRLLVMNLLADDAGALRLYDADFEPVDEWAQARIVVLTGTLKRDPADNLDLLTPACKDLLGLLRQPF